MSWTATSTHLFPKILRIPLTTRKKGILPLRQKIVTSHRQPRRILNKNTTSLRARLATRF